MLFLKTIGTIRKLGKVEQTMSSILDEQMCSWSQEVLQACLRLEEVRGLGCHPCRGAVENTRIAWLLCTLWSDFYVAWVIFISS